MERPRAPSSPDEKTLEEKNNPHIGVEDTQSNERYIPDWRMEARIFHREGIID